MTKRPHPACLTLALALSACDVPLPAGPAPANRQSTSTLPLNAGGFTVADFPDQELVPWGANPYGDEELMLSERDEVAFFMRGNPALGQAGVQWFREDLIAGEGIVPGTLVGCCAPRDVLDAASGNVDGDPADELVVAVREANSDVGLYVVDRAPSGDLVWNRVLLYSTYQNGESASVGLGDFDGDGRMEIALTSSRYESASANDSWLRVLDDAVGGHAQMLYTTRTANHVTMRPHGADLDGDGIDELVVALQGDTTSTGRFAVEVYSGGQGATALTRIRGWTYLHGASTVFGGRLTTGDFDGDGADEVCWAGTNGSASLLTGFVLRVWKWNGSTFQERANYGSGADSVSHNRRSISWDLTSVDRYGTGRREIALMRGDTAAGTVLELFHFDPAGVLTRESVPLNRPAADGEAIRLRPGDGNADGAEELYYGVTAFHGQSAKRVDYGHVTCGVQPAAAQVSTEWDTLPGEAMPAVIATGDLDGDGLHVRYTGVNGVSISDPIPLVLLCAAPTKAGISQNFDDTSTAYYVGTANQESIGVTSATTMTFSAGFEFEDIFGTFGASVMASTEKRFETTQTTSERITTVDGFVGSADHDVIVFQGNLYRSYEYEIVDGPDPLLVGTRYSIDVPVDSNVYKWTVDYYNAVVDPSFHIGPRLLPHTIGDPATYPSRAEVQAMVDAQVGWRMPTSAAVGQGTGTRYAAIELEFENTTEEQRESTLSIDTEFKAGYGVVGMSFGATGGSAYSVSVSELTVYEAEVGDISGWADYDTWGYAFGLAAYRHGVLADANNDPTGVLVPGTHPMTVVTFWTELTGSGY